VRCSSISAALHNGYVPFLFSLCYTVTPPACSANVPPSFPWRSVSAGGDHFSAEKIFNKLNELKSFPQANK
jgi:hypothetical protein